ncbi:MAG: hypothetical protein IPN71_14920 [Fibrobacteres bacterium]|nr:hypothetical protein [Fibrobacterota bacterium]
MADKNIVTNEEKYALVARAQKIISDAQAHDLGSIIQFLQSVLSEKQKKYFVLIDRLDENWVDDKLRYKMIMALFLTARDFIRVENVKIIISMRRDLIERVFKVAKDAGFQEEKYESSFLRLTWSKKKLIEVLDKRINHLVRKRYTRSLVSHRDLLPASYGGQDISDYVTDRAARPRDIIDFFNKCILSATDMTRLQNREFSLAEGEYSRSRLRALRDEWSADFPDLIEFTKILHQTSYSFKISTLDIGRVENQCLEIIFADPEKQSQIFQNAKKCIDGQMTTIDFLKYLVQTFYKVGLVGLKLGPMESASWVDEKGRSISNAEITEDTSVVIHPAYRRALGTRD